MVKYDLNTKKLIEKNPNVKSIILEKKRHNPNYTDEAVVRMSEYSLKASKLKGEELIELKKSTNFLALGELDNDIMYKIMEFIQN